MDIYIFCRLSLDNHMIPNQSQNKLNKGAIRILGLLGDELCVRILEEIYNRPSTVTEVSRRLNGSTSTIWKKMHMLERAGLIGGSKRTGDEGKMTIVYHILDPKLGPCTVKDLLAMLLH